MTALEKYHLEFIEQNVFRLNESLPRIVTCLDQLSEDQIWYTKNSHTNSVGNLVQHLCGNIFQYIQTSIGGRAEIRERDSEFAMIQSMNRSQLKNKISAIIREAEEIIRQCEMDSMMQSIEVQVYSLTRIGIITHVVEHLSYHTGQIAHITKDLINTDLGFYAEVEL